jgi:hypothetical protein
VYYIVRSSLQLMHRYHPKMLPVASTYFLLRIALPTLLRARWNVLRAMGRAYRDYRRGIFGEPSALPGEYRTLR